MDEKGQDGESTSFFKKLKATRIANINGLMFGQINLSFKNYCTKKNSNALK